MAAPETIEALSRTILLAQHQIVAPHRVPDEVIADALLGVRVAIVADAANLASPACQAAVSVLARLVTECGASLTLVMPNVAVCSSEPRFRQDELVARIRAVVADGLAGPTVVQAGWSAPEDIVFVMGDTPWNGRAADGWRLVGTDWNGWMIPIDSSGPRWATRWPLGGLAVAAVAAAEPFRSAMRRLAASLPSPVALPELLIPTPFATIELAAGPPPRELDLGDLDTISGGAIVQAAIDALLRLPGIHGRARVIEPDIFKTPNLNRYQVNRRRDLGRPKIDGIRDAATPEFEIVGEEARFEPETLAALLPLRPRVLVGTDNLAGRWLAQKQWPRWLAVGATADFRAMVSEHLPAGPCAGCVHPHDDAVRQDIPTISFVSYWAGLLLAVRIVGSCFPDLRVARDQVTEINAFRIDSPTGVWEFPLRPNRTCPVACSASREV